MEACRPQQANAGWAIEPVPLIFEYCDRCCHRCALSHRCGSYVVAEQRQFAAETVDAALLGLQLLPVCTSDELAPDLGGWAEMAWTIATEEVASARSEDEVRQQRLESDPLLCRAKEYTWTSAPVLRLLRPMILLRGDGRLIDALTRLDELGRIIPAKIQRAIVGSLDEDYDVRDLQSDANGSAKVARLLIEESRRAWLALLAESRRTSGHAPDRFVTMLDDLETGLIRRFPRALEFIRPGFDTDPTDEPRVHVAGAIRRSGAPEGHA